MTWTKHETSLIHEVMLMAYEQGVEKGKEEAKDVIRKLSERVNELYEQQTKGSKG